MNRALPLLHGESVEITRTVPLILIMIKIDLFTSCLGWTFSVVIITLPWVRAMILQFGSITVFHPGKICRRYWDTTIFLNIGYWDTTNFLNIGYWDTTIFLNIRMLGYYNLPKYRILGYYNLPKYRILGYYNLP